MIEESLNTYLRGHALVSAEVGHNVFPDQVPDDASYPAVVYQVITRRNVHSMSGASGLEFPLIQIGCWARKRSTAKAIRNAVVSALDGYRGDMEGTYVDGILKRSERDTHDPVPGNQPIRVFGVQIDFQFMNEEPIPELASP